MPYEPLHHKYRPQTFGDLVGQSTITLTLSNALKQARIAPAYLFTGPRGTGKTSSARILAKSLNCLASSQPTPHPCGKCEACLAIAKGSALDVIEIDAASNTGVDNIREIIERSRFAPVQCRYKIYAIDECLTGDSLIQTSEGLMRIDDPNIKGKQVLSYNENTNVWEYKKVLRWLERGTKETLTIKTSSHKIRCTANHLIRTETGWIKAGNVREGMKILSPASADVALLSTNMALTEDNEDLRQDISLKEINTEQNPTILGKSLNKQKPYNLYVNADVKKNLIFPTFSKKKEKELKVSNPIGTGIRIKKVMDSGISEAKILSIPFKNYKLSNGDLQIWDILPNQNLTPENRRRKNTTTLSWEQNPVKNGCQTYENTQFLQWTTNLEQVESVSHAGHEKVYDLEVEDNHNFVANGLLVHNCHMLSTAAFNALLKTLEEPPPQVVFILATTDPQRVLSTIISRCQRFDYRRIPLTEMTRHLKYIADEEKIAIADDALTLIAQIANGGLRDAESLLDQLSLLPETISVAKVWDLVGAVPEQDLLKLLQAINGNDSLAVLEQCRSLLDRGREPLVVLQNLASFYLNLLIAKTAPQRPDMTAVTETCWQQLCAEAGNWDTSLILRGQQHLQEAETQLKHTTQPRLWLEVTLLGLLPQASTAIANQAITLVNSPPTPSQSKAVANPQTSTPVTAVAPQDAVTVPTVKPEKNIVPAPLAPPKPEHHPVERSNQHHIEQNIEGKNFTESKAAVTKAVSTGLSSVAVSPSDVEAVAPNPNQDPAANQEIWSKVVSCIQSPMTKTLLEQQCYLVSFDGSSAIIGTSSAANLQKLRDTKVQTIKQAFAQVYQRKVRVQLEVANAKNGSAKNNVAPLKQPIAEVAPSLPVKSFAPLSSAKIPTVQPATDQGIKPQSPPVKNQVTHNLTPTPNQVNSATKNHNSKLANNQAQAIATQKTSVLPSIPVSSENNIEKTEVIAEPNSNQDYGYDELQQAIVNLTQTFEGEVVHLDNIDYIPEESLEAPEKSSPLDLSSSKIDRPNEEDYNDDW